MKKFTLLFSAMLFLLVGTAKGETVTLSYAGVTTTNMTGNNDAALVGLDASQWSVIGEKGSTNNNVGLNRDGNIRLYADKASGNGNIMTVSISEGTIDEITLDIKQNATYEVKAAGKVVTATNETTYTIGASSFSIQNTTTGDKSTQLQLNSITITYTSTGDNGNDTPDDGGDDVTPDDGGDDVTPDDGGDDVTPDDGGDDTPEDGDDDTNVTVGSIDGYSKVTKSSSLVNGDKVVLYCDEAKLGVTGWDGKKDATVATEGWVAYVVEVVDGGFYLKDGDQYITGAESANHFKYGEKAVCGVSDAGVLACGTKFLYKNGDYYRMYTDKSSNSAYKPFYVYKYGAGGETPDTPDTPDTPVTGTAITGLQYADAYYYEYEGVSYYDIDMYKDVDMDTYEYIYPEVYISFEAKSKTALNGTYDVLYAGYWSSANDSVEIDEETYGTITIKNTDNEGNYSVQGSFVGTDGKTYTFNEVVNVYAYDIDADYEDIVLNETGGTDTPDTPGTDNPVAGTVTFDADVDKGNAGTDSNNATAYQVSKEGVTMEVSSGILGTYNNEMHYRIYKNQTLTITSTVGNIVSVEFTCTANDDEKYGPGCWTVDGGDYDYAGAVGTWTGNASSVVFSAATNQVRATQIVVKLGGTAVEDVLVGETPVKMIKNGQLMIIRGENTYNVLGAQMK